MGWSMFFMWTLNQRAQSSKKSYLSISLTAVGLLKCSFWALLRRENSTVGHCCYQIHYGTTAQIQSLPSALNSLSFYLLCLLMYLLFFSTYSLPLSVFVFKLFLYPDAFFFFLFVCKAASQPHCCFPFLLVGHIHSSLPFSSGLKHYGLPK